MAKLKMETCINVILLKFIDKLEWNILAFVLRFNDYKVLTQTITKSKQVQALVKYLHSPNATHFNNISIVNNTANTIFTIFKINISSSLSYEVTY